MADCAELVQAATQVGFRAGTYADGSERGNVEVCFLNEENPVARSWIRQLRQASAIVARIHQVEVRPEDLFSVQISHWRPGDHYGWHPDHDPSGTLEADRKLTIYVNLAGPGGLEIDKVGLINCGPGDALIINSLVSHAAPKLWTDRYSLVAWIPGPNWH